MSLLFPHNGTISLIFPYNSTNHPTEFPCRTELKGEQHGICPWYLFILQEEKRNTWSCFQISSLNLVHLRIDASLNPHPSKVHHSYLGQGHGQRPLQMPVLVIGHVPLPPQKSVPIKWPPYMVWMILKRIWYHASFFHYKFHWLTD